MVKFSDEHVASLKPRELKYDVFESEHFGVRVFPNGAKTWLFTYEVNGFRRYKTIGIFPDMTESMARDTLEMSRRIAEIDEGVSIRSEDTIRFRRPDFEEHAPDELRRPLVSKKFLSTLAVVLAAAAGGAGIAYVYLPAVLESGPNLDQPLTAVTNTLRESEAVPVAGENANSALGEPESDLDAAPEEEQPSRERLDYDTRDDPLPGQKPPRVKWAKDEPGDGEDAEPPTVQASVSRAQFTSEISELEPVDRIGPTITVDQEGVNVIFFTDIRNADGQEVTHVWEHDGREVARVPFDVKSDWRWRVYSRKRVKAADTGIWRVTVYDESGMPIKADGFIAEMDVPKIEPFVAEASNPDD